MIFFRQKQFWVIFRRTTFFRFLSIWVSLISGLNLSHAANPLPLAYPQPKLIVILVIDQFRSDYLTRFQDQFLPAFKKNGELGGFRYLMTQAAYYPYGKHGGFQSVTAPGHASVASGAYPYQHGIIMNEWYDREKKMMTYCTDDTSSPLIGSSGVLSSRDSSPRGSSPRIFQGSTVGDELKNAGYPSRVVSVAIKDRASILLGGKRPDLAIWYHTATQEWISSQYYLPSGQLPEWLIRYNQVHREKVGRPLTWNFSSTGAYSEEIIAPNRGSTQIAPVQYTYGSKESLLAPSSVEMTGDMALKAFEIYQLGRGKGTDLLAISFTTHDKAGHIYGPNSRQMEEITLAEDREISRLLNVWKKKVPGGLKNVLFALTGDHGVAPSPDYLNARNVESGRIDEDELVEDITQHLESKWGNQAESSEKSPSARTSVAQFRSPNPAIVPPNEPTITPTPATSSTPKASLSPLNVKSETPDEANSPSRLKSTLSFLARPFQGESDRPGSSSPLPQTPLIPPLPPNSGLSPSREFSGDEHEDRDSVKNSALPDKLKSQNWILATKIFHFYLNRELIESKKIKFSEVESEVKSYLLKRSFVAQVFTSTEFNQRRLPPGLFEDQILKQYYPGRSGDVVLIPKAYYTFDSKKEAPGYVNHITGYAYDRTVPIILSGFKIKPGIYAREARVIDIATTLTFLCGLIPPSLSEGRVLEEAILTK